MERQSQTNGAGFIADFRTLPGYNGMNHESGSIGGKNKKSFLVYKRNKYIVVPTETIAFFYVKNETTLIVCFDKQEYFVSYSVDQIEQMVSDQQFYRLNRQYLINFSAVKEVEHYFARKLLVNPAVPFNDRLLVSKEKARSFLDWLENR